VHHERVPKGLPALNEGLAFLFEIAALVAISWWAPQGNQ
jgi:hypothetical protein